MSPEMLVLAEAEPFNTVEGNMDCAVMQGAVALPGSETISRQKGTRRNLGGLTADHRPTGRPGPRREGEEPKPMMHGREKSGLAVVAMKPANKAGNPAAELVEPRAGAKGRAIQHNASRTQRRLNASQALERTRQAQTLAATHPRWEPYAGKPHVRICAGGGQ